MSNITLLSSITLIAASLVPFYFASRVYRVRRSFFLLSLTLGLTLLIHGLHHALEFTEMLLMSLVVGLISALLAVFFAILYYMNWRSMGAES
ncbi:MAG: hypothetical protein ACE5HJ_05080 [Thermoplasmata archaeon]